MSLPHPQTKQEFHVMVGTVYERKIKTNTKPASKELSEMAENG